jgi:hypothetical protein
MAWCTGPHWKASSCPGLDSLRYHPCWGPVQGVEGCSPSGPTGCRAHQKSARILNALRLAYYFTCVQMRNSHSFTLLTLLHICIRTYVTNAFKLAHWFTSAQWYEMAELALLNTVVQRGCTMQVYFTPGGLLFTYPHRRAVQWRKAPDVVWLCCER